MERKIDSGLTGNGRDAVRRRTHLGNTDRPRTLSPPVVFSSARHSRYLAGRGFRAAPNVPDRRTVRAAMERPRTSPRALGRDCGLHGSPPLGDRALGHRRARRPRPPLVCQRANVPRVTPTISDVPSPAGSNRQASIPSSSPASSAAALAWSSASTPTSVTPPTSCPRPALDPAASSEPSSRPRKPTHPSERRKASLRRLCGAQGRVRTTDTRIFRASRRLHDFSGLSTIHPQHTGIVQQFIDEHPR